jgi:hypothetical protein
MHPGHISSVEGRLRLWSSAWGSVSVVTQQSGAGSDLTHTLKNEGRELHSTVCFCFGGPLSGYQCNYEMFLYVSIFLCTSLLKRMCRIITRLTPPLKDDWWLLYLWRNSPPVPQHRRGGSCQLDRVRARNVGRDLRSLYTHDVFGSPLSPRHR